MRKLSCGEYRSLYIENYCYSFICLAILLFIFELKTLFLGASSSSLSSVFCLWLSLFESVSYMSGSVPSQGCGCTEFGNFCLFLFFDHSTFFYDHDFSKFSFSFGTLTNWHVAPTATVHRLKATKMEFTLYNAAPQKNAFRLLVLALWAYFIVFL